MRTECTHINRSVTIFRGYCPECATTERERCTAWFMSGKEPVSTLDDLEDFILGALFAQYGCDGLVRMNGDVMLAVLRGIPKEFVSLAVERCGDWEADIRTPIPADIVREVIASAKKPAARRRKKA